MATTNGTARYMALEVAERARAWRQIDGETRPDAKRGAEEALCEAIDELERLVRNSKSAEQVAKERAR